MPSRLPVAIIAGLVLCCLFPRASASAQPRAELEIEVIREAVLYARYEDAIEQAREFLARDDLNAAQRNAGLEVLAIAYLANRDMDQAEPLLAELYSRDPGHHIGDSDASPLVQGAFQRAREASPPPVEVSIRHSPPEISGRSPVVEFTVTEGLGAVGELRVSYRNAGAPRYATLVLTPDADGVARGRLPLVGAAGEAQNILYYVQALAPSMTPLGAIGSEADPMTLEIPASAVTTGPGDDPITPPIDDPQVEESGSKWWIALIVLGVAAGAGVGGYFLLGPPSDEPNGTLGAIDLR